MAEYGPHGVLSEEDYVYQLLSDGELIRLGREWLIEDLDCLKYHFILITQKVTFTNEVV